MAFQEMKLCSHLVTMQSVQSVLYPGCVFFCVCTRGAEHSDAKMQPAILLFSRGKGKKKICPSARLICSYLVPHVIYLFIYLLFNYSLRLSMYAVFWLPGV